MQSQEHYCEWNQKNDKIAVISSSNRTGNIMDIGVLQTGAKRAYLPMTDYEYILNHSRTILCFVSDAETFKEVNLIKDKVPKQRSLFL
jgi:long-chain acyl-CoA synthetase